MSADTSKEIGDKSNDANRLEVKDDPLQSTKQEDIAHSSPSNIGKTQNWVQFDDDTPDSQKPAPAVLNTESVHVNLERSVDLSSDSEPTTTPQRNVNLVTTRPTFVNGDVVVTLLPVNTKWPWITAARFRPELVPEELMAQGLTVSVKLPAAESLASVSRVQACLTTPISVIQWWYTLISIQKKSGQPMFGCPFLNMLTVEEYVQAMELLVNDFRFTLYNVCYKRVLVCWILLAFLVLMALLFSGLTGLTQFSLGVLWLLLNAAAIFICMWLKLQLARGLEKCLGRVNKQLMKHKLLLALDDRGKISCHKVNLCFMYFDSSPCVTQLKQVIERDEGGTIPVGWERRLDVTANDIVIQGNQTTRLSRKQGLAEQAFLRYLQRWGKDFLRHRLDWTLDEEGENPAAPRHLTQALCPCQYIEELLRNKPRRDPRACFPHCNNWLKRRGMD